MENITSTNTEQAFIEVPSDVGVNGRLRIAGDEQVMAEMYEQQLAAHRQAVVEAPVRALKAMGGILVNAASNFAHNVALEAKMATFDTLHGTNYRIVRHELIEQQRRERFEHSIGLLAVRK